MQYVDVTFSLYPPTDPGEVAAGDDPRRRRGDAAALRGLAGPPQRGEVARLPRRQGRREGRRRQDAARRRPREPPRRRRRAPLRLGRRDHRLGAPLRLRPHR